MTKWLFPFQPSGIIWLHILKVTLWYIHFFNGPQEAALEANRLREYWSTITLFPLEDNSKFRFGIVLEATWHIKFKWPVAEGIPNYFCTNGLHTSILLFISRWQMPHRVRPKVCLEQLEMGLRNTTGLPVSAGLEIKMLDVNTSNTSLQSCCLWIRQTPFLVSSVTISLHYLMQQQLPEVHCCLDITEFQVSLCSCITGINKWQFPNAILWFPKTQLSSPQSVPLHHEEFMALLLPLTLFIDLLASAHPSRLSNKGLRKGKRLSNLLQCNPLGKVSKGKKKFKHLIWKKCISQPPDLNLMWWMDKS